MTINYQTILTILFLMISAGCSMPYRPLEVIPDSASFHGAHPSSMKVASSSLIIIHGMCHHDRSWVTKTRDRFADDFQMHKSAIVELGEPVDDVQAYKTTLKDNEHILTLYSVVYSDATKSIKAEALCEDVSQKTRVCKDKISYGRTRAGINASLKNILLNDCLADAVVYLSDQGQSIRNGVKRALAAIYDDRADTDAPTVLLSESLGSKVLRDALLCEPDEYADKGLALVAASDLVFLSANQIALLNLGNGARCDGDLSLENGFKASGSEMTGGFGDVLEVIRSARQFNIRTLEDIEADKAYLIVAFTDPNDLLSYEVASKAYGNHQVVNVIVSNASTWLGLLENPVAAHTTYLENDEIVKIIKCGWRNQGPGVCRK